MSIVSRLWARSRQNPLPIILLILLLLIVSILAAYTYFQKNIDDAVSQINKAVEIVSVEKPGECLILSPRNCKRGRYVATQYGFTGQMAAYHIGRGVPIFAPFDGTIDSILIVDKKTSLQGVGLKKSRPAKKDNNEVIFFFYHAQATKGGKILKAGSAVKKGEILGYVTDEYIPSTVDKSSNLHVGYAIIEGAPLKPQKIKYATPLLKELLKL